MRSLSDFGGNTNLKTTAARSTCGLNAAQGLGKAVNVSGVMTRAP